MCLPHRVISPFALPADHLHHSHEACHVRHNEERQLPAKRTCEVRGRAGETPLPPLMVLNYHHCASCVTFTQDSLVLIKS